MEQRRWQDWVMLVFGIWLFISPFALQYTSFTAASSWNSYILGVAVTAVAVIALAVPHLWEEWVNFVLGIWIVIAPWALGFHAENAATINHVILGVVIAVDALWAMASRSAQRPLSQS